MYEYTVVGCNPKKISSVIEEIYLDSKSDELLDNTQDLSKLPIDNLSEQEREDLDTILKRILDKQNNSLELIYCYNIIKNLAESTLGLEFIVPGILFFLYKIAGIDYAHLVNLQNSEWQKILDFLHNNDHIEDYSTAVNTVEQIISPFECTSGKKLLILSMCVESYYLKYLDDANQKNSISLSPNTIKKIILHAFLVYPTLSERHNLLHKQNLMSKYALKLINPCALKYIRQHFVKSFFENKLLFEEAIDNIDKAMQKNNIKAQIHFRIKNCAAIWFKTLVKKYFFDIVGVRVVVTSIKDCYQTLAIVKNIYHLADNKAKDFISKPKSNGYQSIHAVICLKDKLSMTSCIELQIRTQEMDHYCSAGIASHEEYKLSQIDRYCKAFERKNYMQ